MIRTCLTCLAALLLLGALITPAHAHERSRSYSHWSAAGPEITGTLYLDARQATLLLAVHRDAPDLASAYARQVDAGLSVSRNGEACSPAQPVQVRALSDGRLAADTVWRCAASSGVIRLDIAVFSPVSPNHVHFARLISSDFPHEAILSRNRSLAVFDTSQSAQPSGFIAFFQLGLDHIAGGTDHLAFLLALTLLVTRLGGLVRLTLGFTLGHSITLALAYLGLVSPEPAAIEALIGFSILFVAAEAAMKTGPKPPHLALRTGVALIALALLSLVTNGSISLIVWAGLIILSTAHAGWIERGGDPARTAPAMSAGFGLIHGAGFAGLLLDIDIPDTQQLTALLGFNLGVEAGQILFLGLLVLTRLGLSRILPPAAQTGLDRVLLAGVSLAGCYWFISRGFG